MSRHIILITALTGLFLLGFGCEQASNDVIAPPPPPEIKETAQETVTAEPPEKPAEPVKVEQLQQVEPNIAEPNTQQVTVTPEIPKPAENNLSQPQPQQQAGLTPDQLCRKCTDFLGKYVDKNGLVDYKILLRRKLDLLEVTDAFKNVDRKDYNSWPQEDKMAFWINAYNLHLTKIILENYPIKTTRILLLFWPPNSIRHIKGIWDQNKFIVMGEEFNLQEIENRFFRKEFDDPRVFFAIYYASLSGPPLRNEAYCGPNLSKQLDEQVKTFLAGTQAFKTDRQSQKVYLSSILTPGWQGRSFVGKYGTDLKFKSQTTEVRAVLNFLTNYISQDQVNYLETGTYTVEYMGYDWTLNEYGGQ
ncbi:MAG: DUF547 domain-containing protein [Sedimentisphaerales bacterium]|nr:DUF547 domain-containing protein [Sedimentisphaerales bacterium]